MNSAATAPGSPGAVGVVPCASPVATVRYVPASPLGTQRGHVQSFAPAIASAAPVAASDVQTPMLTSRQMSWVQPAAVPRSGTPLVGARDLRVQSRPSTHEDIGGNFAWQHGARALPPGATGPAWATGALAPARAMIQPQGRPSLGGPSTSAVRLITPRPSEAMINTQVVGTQVLRGFSSQASGWQFSSGARGAAASVTSTGAPGAAVVVAQPLVRHPSAFGAIASPSMQSSPRMTDHVASAPVLQVLPPQAFGGCPSAGSRPASIPSTPSVPVRVATPSAPLPGVAATLVADGDSCKLVVQGDAELGDGSFKVSGPHVFECPVDTSNRDPALARNAGVGGASTEILSRDDSATDEANNANLLAAAALGSSRSAPQLHEDGSGNQAVPSSRGAPTSPAEGGKAPASHAYAKHLQRHQRARSQKHHDLHAMRISSTHFEQWDDPWVDTSNSSRCRRAVMALAPTGRGEPCRTNTAEPVRPHTSRVARTEGSPLREKSQQQPRPRSPTPRSPRPQTPGPRPRAAKAEAAAKPGTEKRLAGDVLSKCRSSGGFPRSASRKGLAEPSI